MTSSDPQTRAQHGPWRVLIVEDDPRIAALHWLVVEGMAGLEPVACAPDGIRGYAAAETLHPHLAIVDLTMAGGDGFEFLTRIRNRTLPIEAIVVTASRDPDSVRRARHLGVVDYLVKPFGPDRLRGALAAFMRQATAMERPELRQEDIDQIHVVLPRRRERLPRGLRVSTMRSVRQVLEAGGAMTADEVGHRTGIARVTARRYLEYLEGIGEAALEREAAGPGRPRHRYRSLSVAAVVRKPGGGTLERPAREPRARGPHGFQPAGATARGATSRVRRTH